MNVTVRKVTTKTDRTAEMKAAILKLTNLRLMVGIPSENTERKDDAPLNNAEIGYLMENGSPAANIPARPFLKPTVAAKKALIAETMRKAGTAALDGRGGAVESYFESLGLKLSTAIKMTITTGIPPPLSPTTIAARNRRHPNSPSAALAKAYPDLAGAVYTPLIDTGALLNSISYVVRQK